MSAIKNTGPRLYFCNGSLSHGADLRFYNIHVILLPGTRVFCSRVKWALDTLLAVHLEGCLGDFAHFLGCLGHPVVCSAGGLSG